MTQSKNLLLAKLSPRDFRALEPHLKQVELKLGVTLIAPKSLIKHVYFPTSGIVSLVVQTKDGMDIETAMVGIDGVLGGAAALDGSESLNKATVQLAGFAMTMAPNVVLDLALAHPAFRSLIIHHDQVLFAEAQQSVACNAIHSVEERMCRWLLRMRDLAGNDDVNLTQEFFAHMIGVTRPSVSITAGALQNAGCIEYKRGKLAIRNIEELRKRSCECYNIVKSHYMVSLPTNDHQPLFSLRYPS